MTSSPHNDNRCRNRRASGSAFRRFAISPPILAAAAARSERACSRGFSQGADCRFLRGSPARSRQGHPERPKNRGMDVNRAMSALDRQIVSKARSQACSQCRQGAALMAQHKDTVLVDAGRAPGRNRRLEFALSQQVKRHSQRVDAPMQERASPEVGIEQAFVRVGQVRAPKLPQKLTGAPIAPPRIRVRSSSTSGRKRVHIPSMQNTPDDRAAAAIASASLLVAAKGFSTSTGFPAERQAMACSRWAEGGVAM